MSVAFQAAANELKKQRDYAQDRCVRLAAELAAVKDGANAEVATLKSELAELKKKLSPDG